MKIVTASNGKKTVKMSKTEWTEIGKKAGWMKKAQTIDPDVASYEDYGKNKEMDSEQLNSKINNVKNNPKYNQLLQQVYSKYPKGSSTTNANVVQQIKKIFESAGFRGWAPIVEKIPEQGNETQEWFIE